MTKFEYKRVDATYHEEFGALDCTKSHRNTFYDFNVDCCFCKCFKNNSSSDIPDCGPK